MGLTMHVTIGYNASSPGGRLPGALTTDTLNWRASSWLKPLYRKFKDFR
ncbi:unnamed protein product, partial [marine sediment metagenome]